MNKKLIRDRVDAWKATLRAFTEGGDPGLGVAAYALADRLKEAIELVETIANRPQYVARVDEFDLVLRMPAEQVHRVASALLLKHDEIMHEYHKYLADNGLPDIPLACTGMNTRPNSIVYTVVGEDIRVNVLSRAIQRVIPDGWDVKFPSWG